VSKKPVKRDIWFLPLDLVLKIHAEEIERRGGQKGILNRDLLCSALAQPPMQFSGRFLHEDVFEMAAAYAFHIAANHPFVDGNKRVALSAALVFLEINGYRAREKGTALADMMIETIEKRRPKQWIATKLRAMAEPI